MKKKVLSLFLALTMLSSASISVMATDIAVDGGNSKVPVELTCEAATFSVTVPTALPLDVAADGTVTVADDAKIINNSHGAVIVTNMTIAGKDNWEVLDWDSADMTREKVGSTKVAMVINNEKTTADDTITFNQSNFPKLDGKNEALNTDELSIVYDAKVPAQAASISDLTVANVVFTIGWFVEASN